jgi:centromere/kinetochore protein ZW10
MIDTIPVTRTRAVRLLDDRCFDLRRFIHEQLTGVWKDLVHWDTGEKTSLSINAAIEGEETNLIEAITSWQAFRELDAVAKQFWQDLDDFILKPRTDIQNLSLYSIHILEVSSLRW